MSNLTNAVNELKPFRFWCQHVLPLVYDDSLSYYELLCKVVNYLNEMADKISLIDPFVGAITQEMQALKDYVDNWIESAHLDEEIDAYIDAKFASQEFTTRLTQIANTAVSQQMVPISQQISAINGTLTNHTNDLNKIKPQLKAVAENKFNYGTALFIGDSWGAAWNAPEGTASTSFEDVIASDLKMSRYFRKDEGGAGFSYANGHWYGKLIADFCEEHPEEVNNVTNIFIIGGQNDLSDTSYDYVYSNEQYECKWINNYITSHLPNAKVWVGMVARTSGYTRFSTYSNITTTIAKYKEACRVYNWNYITNSHFMVHNYGMIAQNDGAHLTHAAYITLGHYLAESIKNGYWEHPCRGYDAIAFYNTESTPGTLLTNAATNANITQYICSNGVTLQLLENLFFSNPQSTISCASEYTLCKYGSNPANVTGAVLPNFFSSLYRVRIPVVFLITFNNGTTSTWCPAYITLNEDATMRVRFCATTQNGMGWANFPDVTQLILTPFSHTIPLELC